MIYPVIFSFSRGILFSCSIIRVRCGSNIIRFNFRSISSYRLGFDRVVNKPDIMYPDEETPLNEENPKPPFESRVQNSWGSENLPNQRESFWQQQQSKFGRSIAESISNARIASVRAIEVSAIVQKGFSSGFQSFVDSTNGFHFACSCLALYYVSAIVAFSHCFESWSYIDSLYFATITFLTIGTS